LGGHHRQGAKTAKKSQKILGTLSSHHHLPFSLGGLGVLAVVLARLNERMIE
jgi:hypothetical protein